MEFSDMQNIFEILKTCCFAFVLFFLKEIRMSFQRSQSSGHASFPLAQGPDTYGRTRESRDKRFCRMYQNTFGFFTVRVGHELTREVQLTLGGIVQKIFIFWNQHFVSQGLVLIIACLLLCRYAILHGPRQ